MGTGEGAAGEPAAQDAADDGWGPLSEDVRRTLELLFDGDSDQERGFRAQIPHTSMVKSDCSCPCVFLRVDTDAVARVPMELTVDGVAGASLFNAEGGYDGEVTVLAGRGVMFDLQFCDWEDQGPGPLRLWEWLGPRHPTTSAEEPAAVPAAGPARRWRWPWRGLRRPGA
ncbi:MULTISPECIES: hypothetical protein [unclassified Streptomyces]|uniref:hypothetical protein n=1 Tax=unclassified Streptomyces TaxID=2593676 RepID=UPI000DC7F158|nr:MULTISPECIES: hypothetical protein [unclassified Streptomyces]AWZ05761.1 hypothetical protein DRB89_15120 [Streptomyces sp. ICC4]AWZ14401.1 hypothetical protein DRB96_21425 [Streptomyces sp. ICC1]